MSSFDVLGMWHSHQLKKRAEEGPKPTATGTRFRCSDAGSCLRKRGMAAIGAAESNAIAPQSLLAFEIGNSIHETLQEAFAAAEGFTFEAEVPIDLSAFGPSLSGHTDGIITGPDGSKTVLEIKSMAGYSFRLAKSGPKREHVAQAGMYALGVEADRILLVYVAKEGDFRAGFKPGAVLEFEYLMTDEVFSDESVYDVAMQEIDRFKMADDMLQQGIITSRLVPDDSGDLQEVERVPGYQERGGKPWQCAYCTFNDACALLPAGPVAVDMIGRISE